MKAMVFSALASLIIAPAWAQTVVHCEGVRACTDDAPCVTNVILQYNDEFTGAVTIFYTEEGQESTFTFPIKRSFESNQWVMLFDSGELQDRLGDNWFALIPTIYGYDVGVLNWVDLNAYSEMKCI